jgi:hypothetical protein
MDNRGYDYGRDFHLPVAGGRQRRRSEAIIDGTRAGHTHAGNLVGAIGSMIISGLIGLFVGAVILCIMYKLIGMWLAQEAQ